MAEIHIERKERTTWPWIVLGLILLALIAWWLLSQRGDRDGFAVMQDTTSIVDTAGGTTAGLRGTAPEAVLGFVQWTDENRARAGADTSHEHTADGIRRLADAIVGIAERDTAGMQMINQGADSLRRLADDLERNWSSSDHAQYARQAFVRSSELMDRLQTQRFPNSANAVAQVRQAAQGVQANRPLLEQREDVQRFFDRAATTLQTMGNAPS